MLYFFNTLNISAVWGVVGNVVSGREASHAV